MNNGVAKMKLCEKLKNLLHITSSLHVSSQLKLQIMNRFIRTQLSFELRVIQFWKNLDLPEPGFAMLSAHSNLVGTASLMLCEGNCNTPEVEVWTGHFIIQRRLRKALVEKAI